MNTVKSDPTIPVNIVVARRERDARPHFIEQTGGEGTPRRFVLTGQEVVIGRGEEADISLSSPKASRQHAILSRHGLDDVIRDNESRNGVFLNGVRIHSAILREGDVVQVADCVFVFREG
jgi:pSer/pThr/pTyr-binding forkhead associated (FHA) protein